MAKFPEIPLVRSCACVLSPEVHHAGAVILDHASLSEAAAVFGKLLCLTAGKNEIRSWSFRHLWGSSDPEDKGEHCIVSRAVFGSPAYASGVLLTSWCSLHTVSVRRFEEQSVLRRDRGESPQHAAPRWDVLYPAAFICIEILRVGPRCKLGSAVCLIGVGNASVRGAADEPTNHLDIETIDSLARAINGERHMLHNCRKLTCCLSVGLCADMI